LASESGESQYELLFDDETTATVDACQLLGTPAARTTMLRLPPGQARAKGLQAEKGLLSRTAEPDEQRLQVLSVVNEMTQDLASVMQKKSLKKNKVSLEDAMRFTSGGEDVSDDMACALEAAVENAQSSCNVANAQQPPPAEPSDVLQDALLEVGRSAARLIPEDRLLAQRFVSVGLEMLVSGGSVMPAHISDQLGPFVGMLEANAQRRLPNRGDAELDAWRKMISQPLETLLKLLFKRGSLETQYNVDGEMYVAVQDALPCLAAVWRYVDPSSNRSGFEDSLRRAVNRFQRTRRSFSFGNSSSSLDVGPSRASRPSSSAGSSCASNAAAACRSSLPVVSGPGMDVEPLHTSDDTVLTREAPAPKVATEAPVTSEFPEWAVQAAQATGKTPEEVMQLLVRPEASSSHSPLRPTSGSRHSSKEIVRSPSKTMPSSHSSHTVGSRCSTPGSTASSGASSQNRFTESTFASSFSNSSTATSSNGGYLRQSERLQEASSKKSVFLAAGSRLVSPKL